MSTSNRQLLPEDNTQHPPSSPTPEPPMPTPPMPEADGEEDLGYEYFIGFFHVTALGEPSFGTLGFTFPHRLRLHMIPSLHQTALAELAKRSMSTRGFQITNINLLGTVAKSNVVAPPSLIDI